MRASAILRGKMPKMDDVDQVEDIEMLDGPFVSHLSTVLPPDGKLSEDVTTVFLPILISYLHHKDEAMVSLRMPLAISIVKLLHVLPEVEMKTRLSGVLLDICHVLRSRDQGSRDTTRKTLTEIAALLGPRYFGFILKELKGALPQRIPVARPLVYSAHVTAVCRPKVQDW